MPLFPVRPFVDQRETLAVAQVYRQWPMGADGEIQSGQGCAAETAFIDMSGPGSVTVAMGGRSVEIAGVAPFAVAALKQCSLGSPGVILGRAHLSLQRFGLPRSPSVSPPPKHTGPQGKLWAWRRPCFQPLDVRRVSDPTIKFLDSPGV